ncbi:MAG: hypothetical protein IJV34_00040 [Prevotella sp.]|nr:hypothetical protein [Prevotella sp.]
MNNTYIFNVKGKKLEKSIIEEAINASMSKVIKNETILQLLTNLKLKSLSHLKMLHPIVVEICECLYLGHNYAALTLTNYLFESMCKMSLILYFGKDKVFVEFNDFEKSYKDDIAEFSDKVLHNNIEKLCAIGMINQWEKDRLLDLKDLYRNPFSHSSDNDYTKNAQKEVWSVDFGNPKFEEQHKIVGVDSNPYFLMETRLSFMKENAIPYFCEIHNYLMALDKRLE